MRIASTSVLEFARLFAGAEWIRTIGTWKISFRFDNPAITAARRLSIIAFLPLIEALRRGRLPGIAIYLSSQTSSMRQPL